MQDDLRDLRRTHSPVLRAPILILGGLIIAFTNVFLLAKGMAANQVGVLMTVAGALATVLQLIVAGSVDRSQVPLRLWVTFGGVVVVAAAGAALIWVDAERT